MKACTKNLLSSIRGCQDTSELTAKKAILGWTDKREKNQFFWIIKKLLKIQPKVANTKLRQCDNLVLYQFVASQLTSLLIYQKVDSTWTRGAEKSWQQFFIFVSSIHFLLLDNQRCWKADFLKRQTWSLCLLILTIFWGSLHKLSIFLINMRKLLSTFAVDFCCQLFCWSTTKQDGKLKIGKTFVI